MHTVRSAHFSEASAQHSHWPSSPLLTSWKEIASFLGKGVRTAQRWEHELQLPVHRPVNGKHVVWAVTAELESWIAHSGSMPPQCTACDCRERLDQANERIAALLEEIAELRRQTNSNVVTMEDRAEGVRPAFLLTAGVRPGSPPR